MQRAVVTVAAFGVVCALGLAPNLAVAQRRPGARTTTIEVRGTAPTPQVVTVRPRETPQYSRQVLAPQYYDRTFWASVFPAYQVVSARQLWGTTLAGAGTARAVPGLELELDALGRDLENRRARLDSLAAAEQVRGAPRATPPVQGRPRTAPPADTTRHPPKIPLVSR